MDETHIILLLAVAAVLVLAVAVVILLPKEKIAPSDEEEETKKASKKKGQNVFKSKPRTQASLPAAVKSQRIKGFDEVEEAEDIRDLVDYFTKKDAKPVIAAKTEEKKKNKQPSTEARAPADKEEGEDYITIKREKKKAAKDSEKPSDESKKKRKKSFLKPEIVQAMREGRKKDREEKKNQDAANPEPQAPKKKKDQKSEESAPSEATEEKKTERKEKKPKEEKDQQPGQEGKKPRPPRNVNAEGETQEQKRPPRGDRSASAPPPKRTPPPIVNTGLEPASLDDMLSAITHYYAEAPNIFKKLPVQALVHILSFLPLKDLITLARVNKFFAGIIKKEQKLWKALCLRDFGITKQPPNSKTWKNTYKTAYQQAHPRS
jgi:hypothetical protein